MIVRFHDGNGDGDYQDASDDIRYYTGDANFNVTATIDANTGEVAERYVYTAYGTATVYDEDWANPAGSAIDGPLYCGYFYDAETSLYGLRNRLYNTALSTFLTRDPIGWGPFASPDYWAFSGGESLYAYANNRPVDLADPTGFAAIQVDKGTADQIRKYCDCKTQQQPVATLPPTVVALVVCLSGKIDYWVNPSQTPWLRAINECGYDKCTIEHEQLHVAYLKDACPQDICKDKTCAKQNLTTVTVQTKAGVPDPYACKKAHECLAYIHEANCFLPMYEKHKKDGNTKCVQIGLLVMKNLVQQLHDHMCNATTKEIPKIDLFKDAFGTSKK